jgi:hypothetical protein
MPIYNTTTTHTQHFYYFLRSGRFSVHFYNLYIIDLVLGHVRLIEC